MLVACNQVFRVKIETCGVIFGERSEVLPLDVLSRKDDAVNGARVNKQLAVAVEDDAARRRNRQQPDALILGALGVVRAFDDLQIIEPDAQRRQHQDGDDLDHAQPHAQVL